MQLMVEGCGDLQLMLEGCGHLQLMVEGCGDLQMMGEGCDEKYLRVQFLFPFLAHHQIIKICHKNSGKCSRRRELKFQYRACDAKLSRIFF
jgi:hypothetical protein